MKPDTDQPFDVTRLTAGRLVYRVVPLHPELGAGHGRNKLGAIAGDITLNGATRAAVALGDQLSDLGTLGGSFSTARAINATGDVVGAALTPGDVDYHGFLYSGGSMMDLNDLLLDRKWEVINALHIDDGGEVLAIGSQEGRDRVVLLVPTTRSDVDFSCSCFSPRCWEHRVRRGRRSRRRSTEKTG